MIKNHRADTYINFLKSSLLNLTYVDSEAKLLFTFFAMLNKSELKFDQFFGPSQDMSNILDALQRVKQSGDTMSMQVRSPQGDLKPVSGLRNITELSHTMIGEKRLDNIRFAMETLRDEGIGGAFIETGIWRGGACIFMRGILKA
jgi:hypothetical protein